MDKYIVTMFSGEHEVSRKELTHDEIQYIIGLLEQEYSGLEKSEEYKDEYKDEKDLCDTLLKKLG